MDAKEKDLLTTAILTISDPRGNWDYGWQVICGLAGMNPSQFVPPFRARTEGEMFPAERAEPERPSRTPGEESPKKAS